MRWSSRADAVKALVSGYCQIGDALANIADDSDEKPINRCKANGLCERLSLLETGIYAVFWRDILHVVNGTQKVLQHSKLDLNTAVAAVISLKSFVESRRECYTEYEEKGAKLSGTTEYKQTVTRQRIRSVRLNPLDYGQAQEAQLSPAQKFKTESFIPVIDQFVCSLEQRLSAYEQICSRFSFMGRLENLNISEIQDALDNLVSINKDDIEDNLGIEMVQFVEFYKVFKESRDEKISIQQFMYKLIHDHDVQETFPNVEIALRIYLVLMVTNCSGERSFSKLKLIKNRLRTTMKQDRLNHLTLMSIEYDILRTINFDDLIREFAMRKSRKVGIWID